MSGKVRGISLWKRHFSWSRSSAQSGMRSSKRSHWLLGNFSEGSWTAHDWMAWVGHSARLSIGHNYAPPWSPNRINVILYKLISSIIRLISHHAYGYLRFFDSRHIVGLERNSHNLLNEAMSNSSSMGCKQIRRSKPQFAACVEAMAFRVFITHRSALGCVTKTLTGRQCSADVALSSSDLNLALEYLRLFAFVGVFERWQESVTRFHRLVGIKGEPCVLELTPTRTMPLEVGSLRALVREALSRQVRAYDDPWDSRLYTEALQWFDRLPAKHIA